MMGKNALARQRAIDIIGAKRLAALEERGLVVVDYIEQQKQRHERAVLAAENARLKQILDALLNGDDVSAVVGRVATAVLGKRGEA